MDNNQSDLQMGIRLMKDDLIYITTLVNMWNIEIKRWYTGSPEHDEYLRRIAQDTAYAADLKIKIRFFEKKI